MSTNTVIRRTHAIPHTAHACVLVHAYVAARGARTSAGLCTLRVRGMTPENKTKGACGTPTCNAHAPASLRRVNSFSRGRM
jgi:hypothetical protein